MCQAMEVGEYKRPQWASGEDIKCTPSPSCFSYLDCGVTKKKIARVKIHFTVLFCNIDIC